MYNFMHSNSLHASEFVCPISHGLVVVHSDSLPLLPMTQDLPYEARFGTLGQPKCFGAHVSIDPGIQGIIHFGMNTFRMCLKMELERAPVITRQDNQGVELSQIIIDMVTDSGGMRESNNNYMRRIRRRKRKQRMLSEWRTKMRKARRYFRW